MKKRSRPRKPLVNWRVYPDPESGLFARVLVHRTRREMQRAAGMTRRHVGACLNLTVRVYNRRGYVRTLPIFAEVHFCRSYLGTKVVVHEFVHAALAYVRRRGLDLSALNNREARLLPETEVEEALAHAHDRMVGAFVNRAYKAGLYGEDPIRAEVWRRLRF